MSSVDRIVRSASWGGVEAIARVAIQLASLVVLARILEPEDFGVAAIVTALLFWFNLIVEQGFAGAIVQREDLEDAHVSSAFWFSLGSGSVIYAGVWLAAPWIESLAHVPGLAALLRTCCLLLFASGPYGILVALFRRELRFRELALATSIGRIGGTVVAIGMALGGAGVWSLIGQRIGQYMAGLAALVWFSTWRPRAVYSFARVRELGRYAVQSLAGELAYVGVNQFFLLLVGSFFGTAGLGYFNVACRVTASLSGVLETAYRQISMSVFSRQQTDAPALVRSVYTASQLSCVLAAPIFLGLFAVAPEVVALFIGEKWLVAVPLVRLVCLGCLCYFAQTSMDTAIDALGRPIWRLAVVVVELVVLVVLLLLGRDAGLLMVGIASLSARLVATPATFVALRRFLPIDGRTLVAHCASPVVSGAVMVGLVELSRRMLQATLVPSSLVLLASSVVVGALGYVLCLRLLAPGLFASLVDWGIRMVRPRSTSP